ncbi:Nucleolar protein 14 [Heterocephalus glaber]|uniref:Nucleolar protein 14 n=1 Tax=Heterocephalus glaber TaxID=10181 RepID=G5B2F0_HETGA|nr:Nucleolar protein 14 [Heterocephalus glaber]
MLGKDEDEKTKKPKHMSADDLNDGFILDRDDRRLLSYKDGKMNMEDIQEGRSREAGSPEEEESEESDEEEEEGQEDSQGPDSHSDLDSDVESEEDREKPEEEQCQAPGGGSLSDVEEQLLVVERIQKCNHPSLAVGSKSKLEKLFGFLLEYVGDLATSDLPDLKAIDRLVVQLYNLCQMFPKSASSSMQFVLQDAMHEMEEMIETRGLAVFPGLDVLIYLKIAGLLFPTSDFWHPVVTPALMCMSQILTKCPMLSLRDVVKGLFVYCLFLDYVSLSWRFIPELVNFLLGILYIEAPNKQSQGSTLVHPFRARGKNSELPLVSSEDDVATWQRGSLPLHWASGPCALTTAEANHIRLSCLAAGLALLKHCVLTYALHPPPPPPLVRVLEFGRKQGSTKEEQEGKRLIHKHKREFKGAVREIRKDNQFLARMQLSEIME